MHSGRRGVDLRYAPPPVLRALAKDDLDAVAVLLAARAAGDAGERNAMLRRFGAKRRFMSRSRQVTYTIRTRVETASGTVFMRRAIVRLRGRRGVAYAVLDWR